MVEFARHFHSIIRWGLVIFLSLIIFGNVIVFLVSVLQAAAPNAGEKFPSTVQEHYGYNKDTDCGDLPQPLRYMRASDASKPSRYEYCSWRTKLTAWRSISCVILTIGAGILLGLLAKRSPANDSAAIWQDPKNVLRALLIPSGAMGLNMFFLMCFDAAAVQQSNNWCNDLADKMKATDAITCDYVPFAVTVGLDFILFFFWGLTVLFIFLRQLKRFRPYMQFQDEMEEDMLPGGGEVSWKKKSGKSWITKHLKKAKDRQKAASRG